MMAGAGMDSQQGRSVGALRSLDTRRFRLKAVSNEVKLYERYFHKRMAKEIAYVQMGLAAVVVTLQLITMGLMFSPTEINDAAIKTSGICPSIIISFAAAITLWATRKPTYCKLHSAMAFHIVAFIAHFYLEFFLMEVTIPRLQERIYFLYHDPTGLTVNDIAASGSPFASFYKNTTPLNQYQGKESELNRSLACLVFSVIIALAGIFQLLMALFMALTTGRAICSGRTQLEGRCLQVEAVNRDFGVEIPESSRQEVYEKESEEDVPPKLERSDTLPPPPYESGYFQHSLTS